MDGWHVRCWCGLRVVGNACAASLHLENSVVYSVFDCNYVFHLF